MSYRVLFVAAALLLTLRPTGAAAVVVTAADGGVNIDAGTLGAFTIGYPALVNKDGKSVHRLIEKKPTGKLAALKYEDGAELTVEITADTGGGAVVLLTFANLPADVAKFKSEMLIDFNLSNGGRWRFGDAPEQLFPYQKPTKPQFYQKVGDASFMLRGVDGMALTFELPPDALNQLVDNRELNWKTFAWELLVPVSAEARTCRLKVTAGAPDAGGLRTVLVDEFGQNAQRGFAGKVKSVDELRADVAADAEYYAAFQPRKLDRFGGLPDSGGEMDLKQTGFFHVERKPADLGDRWILVDPDGNAFFFLGVAALGPAQDYTYVRGRERSYAWLPELDSEFRTAFMPTRGADVLSFFLVNRIRKTGKPYDPESHAATMIGRLRAWGFNAAGAFSLPTKSAHAAASFPYVLTLPMAPADGVMMIPGISQVWDPFDADTVARVQATFADALPSRADDPLLLGYYLVNEPAYEDVPRVVPMLGKRFACKRRLVEMLRERYKTIDAFDQAWGANYRDFNDLIDTGLSIRTKAAANDLYEFTGLFYETYFDLIERTFRQHDRNHLLLGSRLQQPTILRDQVCRAMGRHCDVVSFNYYTDHVDREMLDRVNQSCGGRPMLLSEFFYDSPADSGQDGGVRDVNSQQERGLAYRNYVEQTASLPFVVGVEWYALVDFAQSGAWSGKYNGETGNCGLLAASDRPWKPMLAEMVKTNHAIYPLVLGHRQPFAYDDPRFSDAGVNKRVVTIPRVAKPITIDGRSDGWPNVPAQVLARHRLVSGPHGGGVSASFKLAYDANYLYLLADVNDSTPMANTHTGSMIWDGDAIEVFIGHEQLDRRGPLLSGDVQVLLAAAPPRADGGGAPAWAYANMSMKDGGASLNREREAPKTAVCCKPDGRGYALEAAIPFTALGFVPKEGTEIRFDLGLDDSDDGVHRTRQFMWNGTDRNSRERTAWGLARFGK